MMMQELVGWKARKRNGCNVSTFPLGIRKEQERRELSWATEILSQMFIRTQYVQVMLSGLMSNYKENKQKIWQQLIYFCLMFGHSMNN